LKEKILFNEKQNDNLSDELRKGKERIEYLTNELTGTERQRDEALSTILQQQIITEEVEKRRQLSLRELELLKEENEELLQQRQEIEQQMDTLRREKNNDQSHISGKENLNRALTRSKKNVEKPDWTRTYSSKPSASYEQHLAEQNVDRRRTTRISSAYLLNRPKSFDSLNMYTTKPRDPSRQQLTERKSSIFTSVRKPSVQVESPIEDKISAIGDIIRRITEQSVGTSTATTTATTESLSPATQSLSTRRSTTNLTINSATSSPSSLRTQRARKSRSSNNSSTNTTISRDATEEGGKDGMNKYIESKDSPTLTPELSLSHRTSVDSAMSAMTTISSRPRTTRRTSTSDSSVTVLPPQQEQPPSTMTTKAMKTVAATTMWSAASRKESATNLDDAWGFLKDVYANLDLAEQREGERAREKSV